LPNDLGIKSIVTPQTYSCSGHIIPSITVKNYGSNTVTSCRMDIKINGTIAESKDFNISLAPLAEVNLAFSTVNLTASSSTTIHFEVTLVNGITDAKTSNNLLQQTVITPANTALPVTELFNATPPDWSIQNADGLKTWQNVSLTSNSAMMLNFYDYENEGAVDRLLPPFFNLSNETSALLKFDYAYAPFPGVNTDSLSVVVMTDCGAYLTNATLFSTKEEALYLLLHPPATPSHPPLPNGKQRRFHYFLSSGRVMCRLPSLREMGMAITCIWTTYLY
jgi:hypothetical protein